MHTSSTCPGLQRARRTGGWFVAMLAIVLAALVTQAPAVHAQVPATLPVLIALGDSVTSGHHGGGATTVCDDPAYSYAATVFDNLQANDGEAWSRPEQYVNLAHSGFGTAEVLNGGQNGCGAAISPAPIADAVALLQAHVGAVVPNKVVISVGINNTNWSQVLTGIAALVTLNTPPTTAQQCEGYIQNGNPNAGLTTFPAWDGPARAAAITAGVTSIVNQLVAADPNVGVKMLRYYNVAGTGLSETDGSGPYLPAVCRDGVAARLQSVNGSWIADGISRSNGAANVSMVDTSFMDGRNDLLQQLTGQPGNFTVATIGWPHPNQAGAAALGNAVSPLNAPILPEAPVTVLLPVVAGATMAVVGRRRRASVASSSRASAGRRRAV